MDNVLKMDDQICLSQDKLYGGVEGHWGLFNSE
jgi:hypothetical protein